MIRLAIIVSHPIQYYSPLFACLSKSEYLKIKVFYSFDPSVITYDYGFKKNIEWDIPLLEDYDYLFVKNISKKPGSHHYFGLDNPQLIHEIEGWNPDALLVYGWKYKSHLHVLKHFKKKKPIFFRGDSHTLDDVNFLKKSARKIVLSWVYKKINYAFYVGQNNKKYFLEAGLNEDQLLWAPHSIDNNRFSDNNEKMEHEAETWRQTLSIPAEAVVVLFSGKFEPKKQPLLLLNYAYELNDNNLYFLFVGNGELEEEIIDASKKNFHIKYLPFQNQSQMPLLYRLSDILCLPSVKDETWGLAVNEAMACSRPVLVSNKVGCAKDLVKNEVNGFVFNVNNPIELKEILKSLSHKRNKLKQMGRRSLDIISNWSVESQAEAIEKGVVSKLNLKHEYESFSLVK